MDRGAWQATVHGVTRVGHHLANKPPPSPKEVQDDFRDFLGGPVVKTAFPMQGTWVQFLVGELRSHKP